MIADARSFDKTFLGPASQLFQQRDQVEERVNFEVPGRHTGRHTVRIAGTGHRTIRPFLRDGEAAALGIAQNERVDATNPSFL
jgi:hypothetical protein